MNGAPTEIVLLVLQFLEEEGFRDAARELQRSSAAFCDLQHVGELIAAGQLDSCDRYLSGFTNPSENPNSLKIFFEIRKQKYLEALEARQFTRAVELLRGELRAFQDAATDTYAELCTLTSLDDFRQNEKLAGCGTLSEMRALLRSEVLRLAESNPALRGRIVFPPIAPSALRTLLSSAAAAPGSHLAAPTKHASPNVPHDAAFHPYASTTSAQQVRPPLDALSSCHGCFIITSCNTDINSLDNLKYLFIICQFRLRRYCQGKVNIFE
jgi:hypothetical protein